MITPLGSFFQELEHQDTTQQQQSLATRIQLLAQKQLEIQTALDQLKQGISSPIHIPEHFLPPSVEENSLSHPATLQSVLDKIQEEQKLLSNNLESLSNRTKGRLGKHHVEASPGRRMKSRTENEDEEEGPMHLVNETSSSSPPIQEAPIKEEEEKEGPMHLVNETRPSSPIIQGVPPQSPSQQTFVQSFKKLWGFFSAPSTTQQQTFFESMNQLLSLYERSGKDPRDLQKIWQLCLKNNNISQIKPLISETLVNSCDAHGLTPLTRAARDKNYRLVRLLHELGANLEVADAQEYTPLTRAIRANDAAMVRLLCGLGAKVDGSGNRKDTPLTWAVQDDNKKMVQLLKDLGANVNISGYKNETPLTCAVRNKNEAMVRLLHSLGANLDSSDGAGLSPLTVAVEHKNEAMVRLLHTLGANLDAPNSLGLSPLTWAVIVKNETMVRLLHTLGANLDASDGKDSSPLTWAILENIETMVRLLHTLGAKLDAPNRRGSSPLTWAVEHNNETMVLLLHTLGANLYTSDGKGRSPLTCAVQNNNEEMVRLFHSLGANLDASDGQGRSPLTCAVQYNNETMVRLLHSLGANIDTSDGENFSPLTWATFAKNEKMVQFLVKECKADINAITSASETALSGAYSRILRSMIPVLQKLGANEEEAERLLVWRMMGTLFGLRGIADYVDLSGKLHILKLEGFDQPFPLRHLLNTFQTSIDKPHQEALDEAILFAAHSRWEDVPIESQTIVDRIQRGDRPTFLLTGWHGHSISLVFSHNRVFVCNRGEGVDSQAIAAYQFDPSLVTLEFITRIREQNFDSPADFKTYLAKLSLERLLEEGIDMHLQKVGNCSWANTKAGLLALINAIYEQDLPDPQARHETCKKLYKQYTTELRIHLDNEYLSYPLKNLSLGILVQLQGKIEQNQHIPQEIKDTLLQTITKKMSEVQAHRAAHPPLFI